jgi:hypothetical protein
MASPAPHNSQNYNTLLCHIRKEITQAVIHIFLELRATSPGSNLTPLKIVKVAIQFVQAHLAYSSLRPGGIE